ncbi:hypothetical protein [Kribbella sp. NPDC051770]|uniref:hypothetical protein n=1 Tax=Kribbella sp. NPDC051770 TaxID=3155413 RepID=UPI00343A00D0
MSELEDLAQDVAKAVREAVPLMEKVQRDAEGLAKQLGGGSAAPLEQVDRQVAGLRSTLERAGRDLTAGLNARDGVVAGVGTETPELKRLGNQLTDLRGAVDRAHGSLVEGGRRVDEAMRAGAKGSGRAAQEGADGVREVLRKAVETLGRSETNRAEATEGSQALAQAGEDGSLVKAADLAKAANAAQNPTPKSQQVAPGSASRGHSQTNRSEGQIRERTR